MSLNFSDASDSILVSRQKLRDAYIDLYGVTCTVAKNKDGSSRRDFYGDLSISKNTIVFDTEKLLISLSQYVTVLDPSNYKSNETGHTPLHAICKLDSELQIGDQIKFDVNYFPKYIAIENLTFQIIDKQITYHTTIYNSRLTLSVLRDDIISENV
jgi:hypothetical protein